MMSDRSTYDSNLVEVKAKFECEFRRFSIKRSPAMPFDEFYSLMMDTYHLPTNMPFKLFYTDPRNGDMLPITNDNNLLHALKISSLLRVFVYQSQDEVLKKTKRERTLKKKAVSQSLTISDPKNFYHMCTVVDADLLPGSMRRVKLSKHSHDQSLGFYIRDGTKVCRAPQSSEREPAIFISRLIPGGLAEGTGLLAVNDEILEVNGIKVKSKSLDEVTDIIVANGLNLIITIAPASEPPTTPRLNTKNPVTKNSASLSGAKSTESLSKSCGVGVIKDKSTKKDGATQPHTGNESTKTKTQKEIISTI